MVEAMRCLLTVLLLFASVNMSVFAQSRSGAEIYDAYCGACHHPSNVMVSSPKAGSRKDWEPRLTKGISGLTQSAIQGIEAMPPKGTCAECTPGEIEAAIRFMTNY